MGAGTMIKPAAWRVCVSLVAAGGWHCGSGSKAHDAGVAQAAQGKGSSQAPANGDGSPKIPQAPESCPTLETGTITVMGQAVSLWVGTPAPGSGGPVLFYWHGTGGSASEAAIFMATEITDVMSEGGIAASFDTSLKTGVNTGNGVWYTDDFKMADEILACALQQLNIDPRRVYTAGCSAGGLQVSAMVYARSSYLAAAMPNSGGTLFAGAFPFDSAHVPSLITTHGAPGTDVYLIDFSQTSATEDKDIASHASSSTPPGGYVVDCNHGGGHCAAPADDIAAQWQFCKDHPFGVSPDPYAGVLPSSFPSYCAFR
jgi:poly(3-hydroxybutyrate) depolymerase